MIKRSYLEPDHIYHGDARDLLKSIQPESIALSVWSPPTMWGRATKMGCLSAIGGHCWRR